MSSCYNCQVVQIGVCQLSTLCQCINIKKRREDIICGYYFWQFFEDDRHVFLIKIQNSKFENFQWCGREPPKLSVAGLLVKIRKRITSPCETGFLVNFQAWGGRITSPCETGSLVKVKEDHLTSCLKGSLEGNFRVKIDIQFFAFSVVYFSGSKTLPSLDHLNHL